MPKTLQHIIGTLLLAGCMAICWGCHPSDDFNEAKGGNETGVYITLNINTGDGDTRSNSTGGQYGDGEQAAENRESRISSLLLLFYPDYQGSSLDDPYLSAGYDPMPRVFVTDIDIINQQVGQSAWSTKPILVNGLSPLVVYRMVVVANTPKSDLDAITGPAYLRSFEISQLYVSGSTVDEHSSFRMSSQLINSSDEAGFMLTASNDINRPYPIDVRLERLAARIDLIPYTATNGAVYESGSYTYPITVNGAAGADRVTLTGITPINLYIRDTYLMKHYAVAKADGEADFDNVKVVGKEIPDAGNQTNYVVDPLSRYKTISGTESWYDKHYKSISSWATLKQTAVDASYILSYARENTMTKSAQLPNTCTGISLKATYKPSLWWVLDGSSNLIQSNATPGATFYLFRDRVFGSAAALSKGINQWTGSASSTTAATAPAYTGVRTYTNGVCYYTYWIRHSNDNVTDTSKGIMEYAIVRNNIYRVIIDSFTTIGSPVPTTEEMVNEDVKCSIYVVPWRIILNKKIYI